MIQPSRALIDIFPRVIVGKEQGIITPGTVDKEFSLDYRLSDTAAITWKVPLNTSPVYYRGILSEQATLSDVRVFFRYQQAVSNFLVGQMSPESVNNGLTAPTVLPRYSVKFREQCFDYWARCKIYALTRGEVFGCSFFRQADLKTFLTGFVPYIADYGEGFGMTTAELQLEKNRLFNYPKSLLEYRFITSNVIRILTELSKTPLVYMVVISEAEPPFFIDATTLGELSGDEDEGPDGWKAHFNAGTCAPVGLYPRAAPENTGADSASIGALPLRVLFGSLPVSRHEYNPPGYTPSDIMSSQLLPGIHEQLIGTDELNSFNPPNTLVFFEAIAAAIARLRAMNVPMLKIPEAYGGGEKYVVILPLSISYGDMEWMEKDALFIGVPGELLAAVTYPVDALTQDFISYTPVNPTYTAYVVGSPGIFNFTTDTGKTGFISDVTDFDRLGAEGWEDRNTYHSARAPMGQILATGDYWVGKQKFPKYYFPEQALWQLNSQDTIKIVVCPMGGTKKQEAARTEKPKGKKEK